MFSLGGATNRTHFAPTELRNCIGGRGYKHSAPTQLMTPPDPGFGKKVLRFLLNDLGGRICSCDLFQLR